LKTTKIDVYLLGILIVSLAYQVRKNHILTDTEFVTKLRQSITQARQGETSPWENAKAKLGL
jgi:hypothetical protein